MFTGPVEPGPGMQLGKTHVGEMLRKTWGGEVCTEDATFLVRQGREAPLAKLAGRQK